MGRGLQDTGDEWSAITGGDLRCAVDRLHWIFRGSWVAGRGEIVVPRASQEACSFGPPAKRHACAMLQASLKHA